MYAALDEDLVCVLHGAMDEHLPGKIGDLSDILVSRAHGTLATGLQEALQSRAGDLL